MKLRVVYEINVSEIFQTVIRALTNRKMIELIKALKVLVLQLRKVKDLIQMEVKVKTTWMN